MAEPPETPPPTTSFESRFLLTDQQVRDLGVPEHHAENYRRHYYRKSFALPTWAPALAAHTFRTASVPLTFAEGSAIYAAHHKRSDEGRDAMAGLLRKLDEALGQFAPDGAFIKLDTRSPKDVPVDMNPGDDAELMALVDEELGAIPADGWCLNAEVEAFVKASSKFLRVTTAEKAVRLLTMSRRVSQDLAKNMEFGEKLFEASVVLREWDYDVAPCPSMEFRGFAHRKRLNAVTQYLCFLEFPEMAAQQRELAQRIREFHDAVVAPAIPHESYVVDFFLKKDSIRVIELNPFYVGAGAGLFSWKEDRELFLNGPFEMRVRTCPDETLGDLLAPAWHRYLSSKRPQAPQCVVQ
eukprot:m51a1_g5416 hypothetical protein (353) ;mRNA; f:124055-125431